MAPLHRNTPGCSTPRPRSVAPWLAGLALAALLPAGNALALSPLVKTYPLGFGGSATLTSSADCGPLRCTITNSIVSNPIDRYVELTWRDNQGNPLVSADNSYFMNLWSPTDYEGYLEESEKKWEFTRAFAIQNDFGIADFTGTQPLSMTPCSLANGNGYICKGPAEGAAYYYFPASPFAVPTGGGSPPAPGVGTEIGRITTRFSSVFIDPTTMTVPDDGRFTFLEFVSTVSVDNGMYVYAHEVTNHTQLDIPIVWTGAGIDAIVDSLSTTRVELLSPLAPTTLQSVIAYHLEHEDSGFVVTDDQQAGAMIFAPVPEPATVATLGAGLAVLLWQRRRRERR